MMVHQVSFAASSCSLFWVWLLSSIFPWLLLDVDARFLVISSLLLPFFLGALRDVLEAV